VDVVVGRHAAGEEILFERPAVALVELSGDVAITVFVDQLAQQRAVELARIHVLQALGAAPLPCSIRSQNSWQPQPTPPSRKAKRRSGKAPGDAAEEQRLGGRYGPAAAK